MVGVVGEPGLGKSRLFFEFTHSHRTQGWLILESGSVSYGKATPYLPVIDLLKAYFKIQDRDDQREIREKVTGKLLTLDKSLESTLPAFLALLDVPVDDPMWQALDPSQRRQQTLGAVKRLLLRESQVQPLILYSRIFTGSTPRPRRCWRAWWKVCRRAGCSSWSTIVRNTSMVGLTRLTTPNCGLIRCRLRARGDSQFSSGQ